MPLSDIFRKSSRSISINDPPSANSLLRRLSQPGSAKGNPQRYSTISSTGAQNLAPPPTMGNPGNMSDDAPPTYNEATAAPTPENTSTKDSPFAFLSTFDTAFLIDDSGSMAGSSWTQTSQALAAIAPVCAAHDKDGVDVYFMNTKGRSMHHNLRSATEIREVFTTTRPWGATPTGSALDRILRPYLSDCETRGPDHVKPLNIIVITDGVPTDDPESVIIHAAKRLEKMDAPPYQVGIQFFQVGNEPSAAEALRDLDDGLEERGCPRDIVDTVPWRGSLSGDSMLKVVLGAVNRRLDRKRNSGEQPRSSTLRGR